MSDLPKPLRGEIWLIGFDPVEGHEQSGTRPGLVVSIDALNQSPAEIAIVMPLTSRARPVPSRVRVAPPEGGLRTESFVITEGVRSVSTRRFVKRYGTVQPHTLQAVQVQLRRLLGL
jgi:mRNA interferase MazF